MSRRIPAVALAIAVALFGRGTAQVQGPALGRRVRDLAEAGRLDEAERAARAGGAAAQVALGEVLVLRGRLAAAESTFTAAMRGGAPGRRTAEAALAELALRGGDYELAARRAGALTAGYETDGARWSAEDRTAAGRAYVVLGPGDPEAVRAALRAFDAAVAADSAAIEPRIRLGDLFLDHYNAPDARAGYAEALRLQPEHPRALLGMARVVAFDGTGDPAGPLRKSLAANPALTPALAMLGGLHLDAEAYDSAAAAAAQALATDSASVEAWALLGATAWLEGDSAGFARAEASVRRASPRPAGFYAEVAEAVARHRRYREAARFAAQGVALDSLSAPALGALAMNELRLGDMERGRAHLERAFARDPFHIWYKNTLDLLDQLKGFRTISSGRFQIVAPAAEADLLAAYLGPLLEQAYDSLAARYEYRPPPPIRIELYGRHADFSVRTVGLTGIGALGASFGNVVVMDAPSARDPGEFNWGSTAWHELTHTFTLGLSAHRVPRWFSEGLSVLEERRARPGWGAGPSVQFLAQFKGGALLPVHRLNEGFSRPSTPAELGMSYLQASLVCEMIEAGWGRTALVAMLRGYRDGRSTPAVLGTVLGLTPAGLVQRYGEWLRSRFKTPLAGISGSDGKNPPEGEFMNALREGNRLLEAGRPDEARPALERAAALFPEYTGPGAPWLGLARILRDRGDRRGAAAALTRYTALDESALGANLDLAGIDLGLGDLPGARAALERSIWIAPYDASVHARLAEVAERLSEYPTAVRERRAVIALRPPDLLEARYQLARTLARSGDRAAARREVLQVLEAAPAFEKAQALLLELAGRKPAPTGGLP